jgi:hypothetical protein
MRNSYGASIIQSRGLLAWAKTCSKLQIGTPLPKPITRAMPRRIKEVDANNQLRNIMIQIALSFVEG